MMDTSESTASRFLKSALTEESPFQTTAEAVAWLNATGKERRFTVTRIPFEQLGEWSFLAGSGDLVHRSGKFFRVHGVRVHTEFGTLPDWDQPIIDQPEIGILGIIAREIDGVLHLLMQAKMEPGNPFGVQLSPTVQATRSNYTQVHQGSRPLYLDYFFDRSLARVLVDQLQWEQGSAFLGKRNRNIVVEVNDDVPLEENFRWLTLGQIKKLHAQPNLINMDTRTVVACMPLAEARGAAKRDVPRGAATFGEEVLASFRSVRGRLSDDALLNWLTDLKCRVDHRVERVGLADLSGWKQTGEEIAREDGRFFKVIAVNVEADSREVMRWSQPLIAGVDRGVIGLLVSRIDDVLHALIQARAEPGSPDALTLAPTVHCALGYRRRGESDAAPFVDAIENAGPDQIRYSAIQSEEGGRFYRVDSEYRIVEIDNGEKLALPPNYAWVTFRQLQDLLRHGYVSVEARSLLSCLAFT